MLDHADFIARYDQHKALKVITEQPSQLLHDYELGEVDHLAGAKQVVVAGMGGSALAAEFVKSWLSDRLEVPLVIVRDYQLPAFVGPDTLVVTSSYSGNTEETLAGLLVAKERGAKIAVVAATGALLQIARTEGLTHFEVPGGYQPRLAVLYGVKALVTLLEAVGLGKGLTKELEAAATWMQTQTDAWTAEVPTAKNAAKQIASELVGHPVVVYGGSTLALPTMKWKIDINENAKHLAFYNYLPEFNHNEFNGWAHPERSGIKVIELRSNLDHPQIQKRFDVTNKLLSDRFAPIQVHVEGETKLQQMLWALILGDFMSAYLAFLNGIDPTPVDLIEKLKKELA
jgi:glucose/mannose-6-phosphate isomerase